jgi:ligand-binding SRPBCC domain-containing protein
VATITLETYIDAPPVICFDLMRDVRLHAETTAVTEGEIGLGQRVTFVGKRFGMGQILTVEVVEFDRPRLFVDEMIKGRFRTFKHIHEFGELSPNGTIMKDTLVWETTLGPFGRIVDALFIKPHLTELVTKRNAKLKAIAEAGPRRS